MNFRQAVVSLSQDSSILHAKPTTKLRIAEFARPLYYLVLGVGFLLRMLCIVAFGWWLSPLIRRKDNRGLVDDVTANLYFLISDPEANVSRIGIHQSEFPTFKVSWNNLMFTFVHWQGETNMSVAPRHMPASRTSLPRSSPRWRLGICPSATECITWRTQESSCVHACRHSTQRFQNRNFSVDGVEEIPSLASPVPVDVKSCLTQNPRPGSGNLIEVADFKI